MEKIKKSISINLPILKIYFDEIEQVLDIMKENSESKIEIITSEHKIEDIVELKSLKLESLNYLELKSSKPYLSVHLGPNSSSIYCSEDDVRSLGMINKIEKVLRRGERKIINILASFKNLLILAVLWCIIVPLFFRPYIFNNNYSFVTWGFSFFPVYVLFLFYQYHLDFRCHSTIILNYRKETPLFFKRNKDKIFFTIIGFVLGIISIIVSQFITNYLFKNN